jgi:hemin uptake protein HemP
MKYAVIAAMMLATPSWATTVDDAESQTVVQSGEVIGARAYVQPTLGFELLIRHDGGLYVCRVEQDLKYGFNGNPNVDFVAVRGCISQQSD